LEFEKIRNEILNSIAEDDCAELVKCTPTNIHIFDDQFGRFVDFRIRPHTRTSLKKMVFFAPDFQRGKIGYWRDRIVDILLKLDPLVLMNVKKILIIKSAQGMLSLCERLGLDTEMIPEALFDENDELCLDCLGISWHYESTAVVNVAGIEAASEEICGSRDAYDYQDEVEIGFWTTLLHEIRHGQMDYCPYEVEWISDRDSTEQRVEEWALHTYEKLFA